MAADTTAYPFEMYGTTLVEVIRLEVLRRGKIHPSRRLNPFN
jgi:hypothetical protein